MPIPTKTTGWNTSLSNNAEPSGAKKALGWVLNEKPSSATFNWILNTIELWLVWVQGMQATALTWTALQTFSAGGTFTNTGNQNAVNATGSGSGSGVSAFGGNTGSGVNGLSGASSGSGVAGVYGTSGSASSNGVVGDATFAGGTGVLAKQSGATGLAMAVTSAAGTANVGYSSGGGSFMQINPASGYAAMQISGLATGNRPSVGLAGMVYYDSTLNCLVYYNGSGWITLGHSGSN